MLKNSRDQVLSCRQLVLNPFLAGNSNFSSINTKFGPSSLFEFKGLYQLNETLLCINFVHMHSKTILNTFFFSNPSKN